MEAEDRRLDGNAIGGLLLELFGVELTVATTVTASVLAPRLMVKAPAIGQRSMLTASFRDRLEVILKSAIF